MSSETLDRLDGWKAIADYLGRDVRTVQRWRHERGCPVHRLPGGKGGTVFAYPAELDEWLRGAGSDTSPAKPPQADRPVGLAQTEESARAVGQGGPWRWRRGARYLGVVSAGVILLVVGAVALVIVALPGRAPAIGTIEQRADDLIALDGEGQTLWSFTVPQAAPVNGIASWPYLRAALPLDLDGDAHRDMVAIVSFEKNPKGGTSGPAQIYGLSAEGQLLWDFTADLSFTFGGRSFAPPWMVRNWLVHEPPDAGIWVSFIHPTWWPSFVVKLDAEGRSALAFVNAGHVESLGRVETGRGAYLLVGATNNEYRSATLAVLAEIDGAATSPQSEGSLFACETCPEGRPFRYFVFPRSELNRALDNTYHHVAEFAPSQTGGFEVTVREGPDHVPLRSIYRFSADFEPEGVAMSDTYWEFHRKLLRDGKLDHSPEECPERTQGVRARVWDPGIGWQDVAVPPTFAAEPSTSGVAAQ